MIGELEHLQMSTQKSLQTTNMGQYKRMPWGHEIMIKDLKVDICRHLSCQNMIFLKKLFFTAEWKYVAKNEKNHCQKEGDQVTAKRAH